jgi:ABC-type uncharacterized transport system permease subunit
MSDKRYVSTGRVARYVDRATSPHTIAIAGIAFGIFAFWLALPPFTVRTLGVPLAASLVALACGLAVVTRGERKLGWWAIALGIASVMGVLWLQSKDADALESILTAGVLASMLRFATPLAFAAMGGLVSERSGVVNIGLEGMMLIGAFFGLWAADFSDSWMIGLAAAMLMGGTLAAIHAFFSIHLRADQIVSGFAVNFLALGLTGYLYSAIYPSGINTRSVDRVPDVDLPWLADIPLVGDFLEGVFGGLNLLVWIMFAVVFLVWLVLFRTPIGLRVRSVGEHPRAAETVGVSVFGIRYAAVITSGVLASLGGAFLSIGFVGTFAENMTSGRGFIALAAVIFGKWLPLPAFAATLLFGFGFALAIPLQREADISENIISILPYVLTLVALVGVIGRSTPPAADGVPYAKS